MPLEEVLARICKAKDYYEILDVPRNASTADIKKSYRKLALILHPDKCKAAGAEDCFKKVSSAYNCLQNEVSRRSYDLSGTENNQSNPFHGNANEIFEEFLRSQGGAGGFQFSSNGSGVHFHMGEPFTGISSFESMPYLQFLKPIVRFIPWQLVAVSILLFVLYVLKLIFSIFFSRLFLFLPILFLAPPRFKFFLTVAAFILCAIGVI